jgi:hypothetical protein
MVPLRRRGGVVEVIEEVTLRSDGEVQVEGEVLGELESLEAVDDEGFAKPEHRILEVAEMEEEAMAPQAGEVSGNRVGRDLEHAGGLTQARAFGRPEGDGVEQVRASEPVGYGEGLSGEVAVAVKTLEALDPTAVRGSSEESVSDVAPVGTGGMEEAVRVRAMGWVEAAVTAYGEPTVIAHVGSEQAQRVPE